MVVTVRHEDFVVRPDGYTGRNAEFTRAIAAPSDVQQQMPCEIEHLQVVEHRVRHVDMIKGVRRNAFGSAEMPGGVAVAATGCSL